MSSDGLMLTTIPRAIAGAMRLDKGSRLEWTFNKGDVAVIHNSLPENGVDF